MQILVLTPLQANGPPSGIAQTILGRSKLYSPLLSVEGIPLGDPSLSAKCSGSDSQGVPYIPWARPVG